MKLCDNCKIEFTKNDFCFTRFGYDLCAICEKVALDNFRKWLKDE